MKTKILLFVAIMVMMTACSGARISAPAEEVQFTKKVAVNIIPDFIEHYMSLVKEDRGPNDAEIAYWSAKLDSAKLWYLFLSTKVREENSTNIWRTIIPILQEVATWK